MEKIRSPSFKHIFNEKERDALISQAWQQLSDAEKKLYKEKSKGIVIPVSKSTEKKEKRGVRLNCQGESIADNEAKVQAEIERMRNLDDEVSNMIENAYEMGELNDMKFYFVATTSFFCNNIEVYTAELALSKFSLRQGNEGTLHFETNPGQLPQGAGADAMERSLSEHKYPLPKYNETDETDYDKILCQILDFIDDRNELPIFFARQKKVKEVKLTIEKILHKTLQDSAIGSIKVYPAEYLLFYLNIKSTEIRNISRTDDEKIDPIPSKPFAVQEFVESFIVDGCEFHNRRDIISHCCLANVRCYGYILAKHCCDFTLYPGIDGQHNHNGKFTVEMNDF